jgi:hypothetical protein
MELVGVNIGWGDPNKKIRGAIQQLNCGTHPYDAIKDMDEDDFGIVLNLIQDNWYRKTDLSTGCSYCKSEFSTNNGELPRQVFLVSDELIHFQCLEDFLKTVGNLPEKDIRFYARAWGNVWSKDSRGPGNSAEWDILEIFKLEPEIMKDPKIQKILEEEGLLEDEI